MKLDKLAALYGVANEICGEYSRMTDGYILATGDNVLDATNRIPADMQNIINERQMYFSIRDKITNELKKRLLTEIEYE
jgi:predicted  nucleic acid-binding Zn-ribbon protein